MDITFLLPKPKEKVKEKGKEKAAVKAVADAANETAEDDSGAAGAAAESVVVRDGKLRDLEVLSIWSNHIDKISEETTDKEQTADAAGPPASTIADGLIATPTFLRPNT